MSSTQTQQARQFLAAVEAACADLAAELGDPAAYALELRSAAGLATGSTSAPPAAVPAGAGAPAGGPTRALPLGPPTAAQPMPVQPAPGTGKVLLVVGGALAFIAVLVTAALVLGGVFFMSSSDSGVVSVTPAVPAPTTVTVPDLTGTPEAQARQVLTEAGLGVVVDTAPTAATAGVVLSQDPAAGTSVERGVVIRITVSSGP